MQDLSAKLNYLGLYRLPSAVGIVLGPRGGGMSEYDGRLVGTVLFFVQVPNLGEKTFLLHLQGIQYSPIPEVKNTPLHQTLVLVYQTARLHIPK